MRHPQTLEELNTCSAQAFGVALADIWEHSPWVPARVVHQRPFASVDALHQAMVDVVAALDDSERVVFYAGHPELAGADARRGSMTAASVAEQGTLSLASLSNAEARHWDSLNQAYRARFGFPFILCIRRHTRDSALRVFEQRLEHDRATEMIAALDEIAAITQLRLESRVFQTSPTPTPVILSSPGVAP